MLRLCILRWFNQVRISVQHSLQQVYFVDVPPWLVLILMRHRVVLRTIEELRRWSSPASTTSKVQLRMVMVMSSGVEVAIIGVVMVRLIGRGSRRPEARAVLERLRPETKEL